MWIYRRMIDTPKSYEVCRDVIRGTMQVLGGSRGLFLNSGVCSFLNSRKNIRTVNDVVCKRVDENDRIVEAI